MKVEELRIGNYVHIPRTDQNVPISAISDFTKAVCVNGNLLSILQIEEIEGIPLTNELVLKCNFKSLNTDKLDQEFVLDHIGLIERYGHYIVGFVRMHIDGDGYKLEPFCVVGLDFERLQYLHQLQNLYFLLEGKELEVNL